MGSRHEPPRSPSSAYRSPFVSYVRRTLRQRIGRWLTGPPLTEAEADALTAEFTLGLHGLRRGYDKPPASTMQKGRGRTTPATATAAGCSSLSRPGGRSEVWGGRPGTSRVLLREHSSSWPGAFIGVTAAPGASGAPLAPAGSADPWAISKWWSERLGIDADDWGFTPWDDAA